MTMWSRATKRQTLTFIRYIFVVAALQLSRPNSHKRIMLCVSEGTDEKQSAGKKFLFIEHSRNHSGMYPFF